MIFSPDIQQLAEKTVSAYAAARKKIVTAESCTGGLIAAALTSVAGSSVVVERGFVSYSNESKTELLGVMPERIVEFGAVSAEVADDMAVGALEFSQADLAISVTGIAGPGGGSMLKPVGLVFFGIARRDGVIMRFQSNYSGDRDAVRMQSVKDGLKFLISMADGRSGEAAL